MVISLSYKYNLGTVWICIPFFFTKHIEDFFTYLRTICMYPLGPYLLLLFPIKWLVFYFSAFEVLYVSWIHNIGIVTFYFSYKLKTFFLVCHFSFDFAHVFNLLNKHFSAVKLISHSLIVSEFWVIIGKDFITPRFYRTWL